MGIRAILLLTLFLLIAPLRGQAQDEFEVITADNAAQLQEIARYGDGVMTGALAWSPDGNTLAVGGTLGVIIYERETQYLLPTEWVENLVFDSQGRTLAAVGRGVLTIWSTENWQQIAYIITADDFQTLPFTLNYSDVVAFSPDDTQLAVGGNGAIWIYDAINFNLIHKFTLRQSAHVLTLAYQSIATESLPILVVDFEVNQSTCGEGLISNDWQAFNTDNFSELVDVDYDTVHPTIIEQETRNITPPTHAFLSARNPNWVGIVTSAGTQWLDVITGEVITIAVSPDSPSLPEEGWLFYNSTATSAVQVVDDEAVSFWRVSDGTHIDLALESSDAVVPPYFNLDGHIIVLRRIPPDSDFRYSVNLYDVLTGVEQPLFEFQSRYTKSFDLERISLSSGNNYALTLDWGVARIWEVASGQVITLPNNIYVPDQLDINTLQEERGLLAYQIPYAWDYEVGILDLNNNETSGGFHLQNASTRRYFFDTQWNRLVMIGAANFNCQTSIDDVEIWDTAAQTLLHAWHVAELQTLSFDTTEKLLIAGTVFGEIIILDTNSGQELVTLNGHQGSVRKAYIINNGTLLLTEGADGTVRVWGVPAS